MARIAKFALPIYWLVIFVATHLPQSSMPSLQWSDKFYHFAAFAVLAFLLAARVEARFKPKKLATVFAIASAYAVFDEFTQQFVPGRQADVYDACADIIGVLIGMCGYLLLVRLWPRGEKS